MELWNDDSNDDHGDMEMMTRSSRTCLPTHDLPSHRCHGLPSHRCHDLPSHCCSDLPSHRCHDLPSHRCHDLPSHCCSDDLPSHRCPSHRCHDLPSHRCHDHREKMTRALMLLIAAAAAASSAAGVSPCREAMAEGNDVIATASYTCYEQHRDDWDKFSSSNPALRVPQSCRALIRSPNGGESTDSEQD
ncbi:hypothetical protein HAZT_HAZT002691 [Hyalella azteca]|uniref:Uncharacterized protein n=1 Tax=Hyalella azteca TaxID=294128 RepID=A0A6A0GT05_HYAAZ|nr:hypothetical protein HAZT_HAZT002691 [Hyalella azteca]